MKMNLPNKLTIARIILAEATVYIASSKKSNCAYLGIEKALSDVANKDTGTIPMHIRNAPAERNVERRLWSRVQISTRLSRALYRTAVFTR